MRKLLGLTSGRAAANKSGSTAGEPFRSHTSQSSSNPTGEALTVGRTRQFRLHRSFPADSNRGPAVNRCKYSGRRRCLCEECPGVGPDFGPIYVCKYPGGVGGGAPDTTPPCQICGKPSETFHGPFCGPCDAEVTVMAELLRKALMRPREPRESVLIERISNGANISALRRVTT